MKVSLNWAQHHSNVNLMPNGLDDLVQKIGAQLGAVEEVIEYGPQYEGAVVVTIVACEKHPNADKLNVCWIDDGGVVADVERSENGLVRVVCGAPNVAAGLTVVWLPPGATVPSTYHTDPFVLGTRELRGIVSNGMLASAQELAISDNHDGILVIHKDVQPGTAFKTMYGLDDVVIDIENKMFTHRPDCFGVLGVAREIAGIYEQEFKSPDWYLSLPNYGSDVTELPLHIRNEIPQDVPRFMAVAVKNVAIKPSPLWLQAGLARVGIKAINNIVDITNYLAYITGQPLHAYDYDKVASLSANGATLVIRYPQNDEQIALLNGKTVTPRDKAIMIATDQELIGVGGVMGGSSTEVDESTTNIIIECANFNMYSIRRTSMANGLFTDAVTRNNKGQSPLQNSRVIVKALELVMSQAGGEQASTIIDIVNCDDIDIADDGWVEDEVQITSSFINNRLGLHLEDDQIIQLLRNVEFGADKKEDSIALYAPFWRTDIALKEDIVEEVGRLHDFANMPLELPARRAQPTPVDRELQLKQAIRKTLASFGANEVLTYSFVHGNLLEKAGQSPDYAFKLTNALSPDLQYYRMSLTPSLLAQIHPNIKAGYSSFSLFEINKTHITLHKDDDAGLPKELGMVTLVTADKLRTDAAYYQARAYLDGLAADLGVTFEYKSITESMDYQLTTPFDHTRSALVSVTGTDIFIGIIGEYKTTVTKALKLPQFCAGFELDMDGLLQITEQKRYAPLSRYPSIAQDICFEVDASLEYAVLTSNFDQQLHNDLPLDQLIIAAPIDLYQASESDKKRITYRVTLTSYERTLSDAVLSPILDLTANKLHDSLGAVRI